MTPPKRIKDGIPRTTAGGRIYAEFVDSHQDTVKVHRVAIPGTKRLRILSISEHTNEEVAPVLDVETATALIAALTDFVNDEVEVDPVVFYRFGRPAENA